MSDAPARSFRDAKRAHINEALAELENGLYSADIGTKEYIDAMCKAMSAGVSKTALFKVAKARDKAWDRQGPRIVRSLNRMLTPDGFGERELHEALDNVDAFEFAEDIDTLHKIHEALRQVSVRATQLADRLQQALQTKDKLIDPTRAALPAPKEDAA
jgi:hypothetical protein